jgi:hypothetical protein
MSVYGQPEYQAPPPEQPGWGPPQQQPGWGGPPQEQPGGWAPPQQPPPGDWGPPQEQPGWGPPQEYPGWESREQPDWESPASGRAARLLVPLLIGSAVTVVLGVYSALHEPTGIGVNLAGFSSPLPAKSWLATGAVALAVVQLLSSFVMYDKVPGIPPPFWIGGVHRWSGRIAFLLAIPVAIHCLYAIGFVVDSPRALIHSLLGCLFFGAFVIKMLGLRKEGLPGWALPLLGGLVFTMLVGLWLTSSLWYFTTFGLQR